MYCYAVLMLYNFLFAKHKLRMCFPLQLATATRRWLKLGQHRCLSCAPTQGSLMIGLWRMQSVCVPPFQRSSAAASSPILGNLCNVKIVGRFLPPNFILLGYTSLLGNFFSQFWGTDLVTFPSTEHRSEANDLALQIAQTVTGHSQIICLEGYVLCVN